jgi:hypothetical protein
MPTKTRPLADLTETEVGKLFARAIPAGDCWEWQGTRMHRGHGQVALRGRMYLVHRISYSYFRAEIPEGLILDHLCRNPPCFNPWHVEPVTIAENTRRGIQSFQTRTHCLRGHELTPENVGMYRRGQFFCRTCRRETVRANRARRKSLSLPVH